jgi:hypothetical protein
MFFCLLSKSCPQVKWFQTISTAQRAKCHRSFEIRHPHKNLAPIPQYIQHQTSKFKKNFLSTTIKEK